jgi:ribonucleoside-diphosphate reductase alpha chain
MSELYVVKRNGKKEPVDLNKIHEVVQRACQGLDVSASEIELRSHVQFRPGIKTSEIHDLLVTAAADLITEDTPDYQFAAGRLLSYGIRKQVFGQFEPPKFSTWIKNGIMEKIYDEAFWHLTDPEWEQLDEMIDHSADDNYTYAGMMQFYTKYLLRNRVTGQLFESPQIAILGACVIAFIHEEPSKRLGFIAGMYDAVKNGRINLPTPIMAGLRSTQKQFSSCVLIETDDSLDSINATSAAIVKYVSQKAGIGINGGRIRAQKDPVRGGDTSHTGAIGFFKLFNAATASCSQGGVRKGSATLYFPLWHLDIEDFLVLKNGKGTEETRIRTMDYGVQLNKLFYERLLSGGDITLLSPKSVPGLYDAFFADQDKFRQLYEAAEKDPNIRKKVVKAAYLFSLLQGERKETGRIYVQNVDHANDHGSFLPERAPIRMSNLCTEINLPTKALQYTDDPDGEIALCTLLANSWASYKKPEQMRNDCRLSVRALDNILSYQDYPVFAAMKATMDRRPLGIGITNFAYWMAQRGFSYENPSEEALKTIDEWAAKWSYYLIEASAELAAERGACFKSNETRYHQGVLPIDTAKKKVEEIVAPTDTVDWQPLRALLRQNGIRNSTLMACMPCETSALVNNHTNGIEPVRKLVAKKKNKDLLVPVVVPGIENPRIRKNYEIVWSMKSPRGYLSIMAVLQRYIDQGISVNTSYNQEHFDITEGIPMSVMLKDLVYFYQMGGKQLYYFNTNDGAGEIDTKELPSTTNDEDCESCKV